MNSPRWIATLVVLGVAARAFGGSSAAAPKTEELRNGRWVSVDPAATQQTLDPGLRRVEDLLATGQYSSAKSLCVDWLKANPSSPQKDRGLFLEAEALYGYGDRVRAFFYLDELMDERPDSPLFYPALEKQYQIADEFLPTLSRKGVKSRFLGMPILGREEEAVEMLYRIQQRSPGSALAEKALLRTADFYYADAQYDLAGDAYGAYAHAYPRSTELSRVKLLQAFSNYAQYRGPRFDATPAIDARAQLNEVMGLYPDVAKEENIPALIARIDESFARKLLITADFYRRTREPVAAVYLYRFLLNAYPNSGEAHDAQIALGQMPKSALETPAPGGGSIGIPSSQPSAMAQ